MWRSSSLKFYIFSYGYVLVATAAAIILQMETNMKMKEFLPTEAVSFIELPFLKYYLERLGIKPSRWSHSTSKWRFCEWQRRKWILGGQLAFSGTVCVWHVFTYNINAWIRHRKKNHIKDSGECNSMYMKENVITSIVIFFLIIITPLSFSRASMTQPPS